MWEENMYKNISLKMEFSMGHCGGKGANIRQNPHFAEIKNNDSYLVELN